MAWTTEQANLLNDQFSYAKRQHRELIQQKLTQFNQLKQQQVMRHRKIGMGFGVSLAVSMFGPSFILISAGDLSYLVLGMYILYGQNTYYRYAEAFKEMLQVYDWCIPNGAQLPPVDNALMQELIETLGTLVEPARLQRLSPLIHGVQEQSSASSILHSATQNIMNYASGFFSEKVEESEDNVMPKEMFSLLVRQLAQGKSASMIEYYSYGQGRIQLDAYAQKGWALLPAQVKQFLNEDIIEDANHTKSI